MDSSVALGAVLWFIGLLCVAGQVAWNASDRRKEAEEAEAAEETGEDPPPPGPDPWDRLPIQDRLA